MVKPPAAARRSAAFFKVMIGDFKSSLRIPPPFVKNLRAKLGAESVLRSPTGRNWRVKLGRTGRQWSFESGWESFAEDHSLALGDFLLFSYDGCLGFDVTIFGKSGCERMKGGRENVAKPRETSIEKRSSAEKEGRSLRAIRVTRASSKIESWSAGVGRVIGVTKASSKVESWSAHKAACSFKPPNPHFISIHRGSPYGRVTIPRVLVNDFTLLEKKFVVLRDPEGSLWHVRLRPRKDGRAELGVGWCEFYRTNCLKEGDTSVFEFAPGDDKILVHIFQEKEKITGSASSGFSVKSEKVSPIENRREQVLHAVDSFKTTHPYFVHLCRPPYICHMNFPKKVANELNLKKQRLILYDPCGRSWPVKVNKRTNGITDLSTGYLSFSRGNNLKEGDACIFEFVGADAVQVHIFRVKDTKAPKCSYPRTNP